MAYRITTQKQLREEFWESAGAGTSSPSLVCNRNQRGNPLPQNQQPADTRMAFVDWIDSLQRNGDISEQLAQRATL